MKCPRCQEGDLYETKNPYKKMTVMHEFCSNCGLRYEKEHGFFYGAMYVSYMLNIALFVTCVIGYFTLLKNYISGFQLMVGYVVATLLLTPVYHRLSRVIWFNFFQKYQPEKQGEF